MKRFILDYYRRWSVVLAIGAVLQLIQGWWITVGPKTPIEFTAMAIPLCVGEILVLCDLSRGMFRVVATLPLSSRQIGLSWWLANVLIPACILIALLFLGAGSAVYCHSSLAFPLHRLLMGSLLTVVWLGTLFCLFLPVTRKLRNRWLTIFIALLMIVFTLWMVWCAISSFLNSPLPQGVTENPVKLAILLAAGTLLMFVGWFRAQRFDPAGVQLGSLKNVGDGGGLPFTPLSNGPHQPSDGYGGILFLLRTTFTRGFLVCLFGAAFWGFVAPRFFAGHDAFNSPPTSAMVCMLVIFRIPHLAHLRFLRTLPISAAMIAAVIILLVTLPFIVTGVLMAGFFGVTSGTPAALTILNTWILTLAPMALCIFFAVWRGQVIQGYAFSLATMMAWVLLISCWKRPSFPVAGGFAASGVMLSWLLTTYALVQGSRAYRAQPNSLFGSFPWNAGR